MLPGQVRPGRAGSRRPLSREGRGLPGDPGAAGPCWARGAAPPAAVPGLALALAARGLLLPRLGTAAPTGLASAGLASFVPRGAPPVSCPLGTAEGQARKSAFAGRGGGGDGEVDGRGEGCRWGRGGSFLIRRSDAGRRTGPENLGGTQRTEVAELGSLGAGATGRFPCRETLLHSAGVSERLSLLTQMAGRFPWRQ